MNTPPLIIQLLSLLGAFMCLAAYVGHQFGWLDSKKYTYNILNAVGSGILGYIALKPFQAGFLLMEIVWCLVSLVAIRNVLKNS